MGIEIACRKTAEEMKEVEKHYKKLDEICRGIMCFFKANELCVRDADYVLDRIKERINEKCLETRF